MKRKNKVGLAVLGAVCVGVFYAITKKKQPTNVQIENEQKAKEVLETAERELTNLEKLANENLDKTNELSDGEVEDINEEKIEKFMIVDEAAASLEE
jgi:hypothetical protein